MATKQSFYSKAVNYVAGYFRGENRSRVAILLAPVVAPASGALAKWFSEFLGLSQGDAEKLAGAVVIGVLVKLGIYIKNNGLIENAAKY